LSYPLDPAAARAHLAASIYVQMALKPHIVHVVGYTEADHAATAADVIESCQMARRAIENAVRGAPDMLADPKIAARRIELVEQAQALLQTIRQLADEAADPLSDPETLARAVTGGLLDAPQLRNNRFARGQSNTRIINGACVEVDAAGQPRLQGQRVTDILAEV
jgi:hypothetical protein